MHSRDHFVYYFLFLNDTATAEIYTLSLHDALPIFRPSRAVRAAQPPRPELLAAWRARRRRYHLAQDRRPGEGVFHRAPASRAGAPQMSDRVLAALEGGVLTATLNQIGRASCRERVESVEVAASR